jgi:hypothetical protein
MVFERIEIDPRRFGSHAFHGLNLSLSASARVQKNSGAEALDESRDSGDGNDEGALSAAWDSAARNTLTFLVIFDVSLSRITTSATVSFGFFEEMYRRISSADLIRVLSAAATTSPTIRPAMLAGLSGATAWTTAARSEDLPPNSSVSTATPRYAPLAPASVGITIPQAQIRATTDA